MSMMCGFIIMNFWVKSWRIKYCWHSIWYFKITDSDHRLQYVSFKKNITFPFYFSRFCKCTDPKNRKSPHPLWHCTDFELKALLYRVLCCIFISCSRICMHCCFYATPPLVWFSTYFDWCFYIASDTVINSGFHKVLFSSHKWWNFLEEKDILVKRNLSRDDERFGYIQCSAREWYALIE